MTATVIDLSSRRRNPEPTCGCPRHELGALAARTRALLDQSDGQLLIPRDHLAAVLNDLHGLKRPDTRPRHSV